MSAPIVMRATPCRQAHAGACWPRVGYAFRSDPKRGVCGARMSKSIVCISGTVWSADLHAPRKRLVAAGFVRPVWFTTDREITDGRYVRISETQYHMAAARREVLVHVEYGGGYMGIMKREFEAALQESARGVLVVGPPEVAVQIAERFPEAILFVFRCVDMQLSDQLAAVAKSPRFHGIDLESWEAGAWDHAYEEMLRFLDSG